MNRRSTDVPQPDVDVLANRAVGRLSVAAGQVIWIWPAAIPGAGGGPRLSHPRAGAFWTLRLIMEPLLRRVGQEVPEPYLGLVPGHELRWLADVDAIVEVRDHGTDIPGVPLLRRRAMAAEWIASSTRPIGGASAASMSCTPPRPGGRPGHPLDRLRQACRRAVEADDAALERRQEEARRRLAAAREVRVASVLGTDLRLRVDGRPVYVDGDSLPRGEVYVAPHEDSPRGGGHRPGNPQGHAHRATAPHLCRRAGRRGRGTGTRRGRAVRELLLASSGDKDVIAEFAVGLNPGITRRWATASLTKRSGAACTSPWA